MTRTGIEARRCFVAALLVAIAGSVHAEAAEELGGDEAAARLAATVTEARAQRGAGQ